MIKFFFFFIALANLSFFLWELQYGSAFNKTSSPSVTQTPHTILLLSEAPAANNVLSVEPRPTSKMLEPEQKAEPVAIVQPEPEQQPLMSTESGAQPQPAESGHSDTVLEASVTPSEKVVQTPAGINDVTPSTLTADMTAEPKTIPDSLHPAEPDSPSKSVEPIRSLTAEATLKAIPKKAADTDTVTEANPDKMPEAAPETRIETKAESTSADCIEEKTFVSKQAALNALPPQLDASNIQEIEQSIPSSYLVYIPAARDFSTAKATEQQLKAKNITNLWLFRQGPMKNAISLGLFIKKQRAENLARQLKQKEIDVNIETRYKTIKRWRIVTTQADCKQQNKISK